MAQATCNVGKRFYAENERELPIMVGDDNVNYFKLTKDYNMEDFRAFIKRSLSPDQQIQLANQTLVMLKSTPGDDGRPMISDTLYADLWNRSTPEQVDAGLRKYVREKELALIAQQETAAKQNQVQAQQIQQQMDEQGLKEAQQKDQEDRLKQEEINVKKDKNMIQLVK
jgi:hypothetical protein